MSGEVCLSRRCDGCCAYCLIWEVWSCRCPRMGSMGVSSCRCCMFVSCVHPVAVFNSAFCMTSSLLMLVGDTKTLGKFVRFFFTLFLYHSNCGWFSGRYEDRNLAVRQHQYAHRITCQDLLIHNFFAPITTPTEGEDSYGITSMKYRCLRVLVGCLFVT